MAAASTFVAVEGTEYPRTERRPALPLPSLQDHTDALNAATGGSWYLLWDPHTRTSRLAESDGVLLEIEGDGETSDVIAATQKFIDKNQSHLFAREPAHDEIFRVIPERVRSLDGGRLWVLDFEQIRHGLPIRNSVLSLRIRDKAVVQIEAYLYPDGNCNGSCPLGGVASDSEKEDKVFYPTWNEKGELFLRRAIREQSNGTTYIDEEKRAVLERRSSVYPFVGRVMAYVHQTGPADLLGNPLKPSLVPFPRVSVRVPTGVWQLTGELGEFRFAYESPADTLSLLLSGPSVTVLTCGQPKAKKCRPSEISFRPNGPNVVLELVDRGVAASSSGHVVSDLTTPAQRDVPFHIDRVRTEVARYIFSPWMKRPVPATVNNAAVPTVQVGEPSPLRVGGGCNAFFDGVKLNFFEEGETVDRGRTYRCNNTGTQGPVIIHEWTHGLIHSFTGDNYMREDLAFSEGAADVVAAHMMNNSKVGIGMFQPGPMPHAFNYVRDVAEKRKDGRPRFYPADVPANGDPHIEGLIFAGAAWELRQMLIDRYGPQAGAIAFFRLFLRALTVTQIYTEFYDALLLADDNDSNLRNGTPNEADIRVSFGARCLAHADQNAPYCYQPL